MKRTPLAFVALVPFAVMAAEGGDSQKIQVDAEKLRSSTPATALLNENVKTADDRDFGDVEDIVISDDGEVRQVLVNADRDRQGRDGQASPADANEQPMDSRVAAEETRVGQDRNRAWQGDGNTVAVSPDQVRYDDANDEVIVETEATRNATQAAGEQQGQLRVSEVIGMEVHLSDEESYGSVEEVMLSEDNSEVVAVVVDNWDGFDKQRRALPVKDAEINQQDGELTYQFSQADVQNVPEFNLDEHRDDGWNVDDWL